MNTHVLITIDATYDRAANYELEALFTGLASAARDNWLDAYGSDVTNDNGRRVGTISIVKTEVAPHPVDEYGQPTRYIVDGRESDHPEANDAADGEVPPFQVFDIETQRHVPILYVDRATAQIVANALNANWRVSL